MKKIILDGRIHIANTFSIIGHRGLPEIAPENSGTGFRIAAELGIPIVELDVRLTRDRELVVIHDNDIRKISDGKGKVNRSDLRYLRQFDYGRRFHSRFKGEKLLTLEEALKILLPKVIVMVELKEDKRRRREMAQALARILEKDQTLNSKLIICSFSDKLLLEVRRFLPFFWLGFIFRTKPKKNLNKAFHFGFASIHPHRRIIKKSLIELARSLDIPIFVWTVNSLKEARKWKERGVQGVITDQSAELINRI